jgi:hypothetical protein
VGLGFGVGEDGAVPVPEPPPGCPVPLPELPGCPVPWAKVIEATRTKLAPISNDAKYLFKGFLLCRCQELIKY